MEPIVPLDTELYCRDNARDNCTDMYDVLNNRDPWLILRRGCTFFFAVRFDRNFVPYEDIVRVKFTFGTKPRLMDSTKIVLELNPDLQELPNDPSHWSICLNSVDDTIITIKVQIPAQALVGKWKCSLQTYVGGTNERNHIDYELPDDIYVLFNPWCPDDTVYMENEEERNEYVLNETGKIWCGTFKNPTGLHWVFGQFDDVVLPAALLLMEKSGLIYSEWGNPILVTRAISTMINSNNDDGLVEGRWYGNYEEGTSPFAWTGSAAIMREYLNSGGIPVKFGQCWVFAGATVTVCRTLGIPCRSTTNYVSAHDTNKTMTVDRYFDVSGNKIENSPVVNCRDSLWNFHVWNDVWMARPDLPPGYGGWQIIDATPQERSGQIYRCGPASVVAVRNGEVGYLYDTPFVFSEVNADIVHFKEDERGGRFLRVYVNKYHVGRKILTKQIGFTDHEGDSDSQDVTDLYKNPENTIAERLAVFNAVQAVPDAQEIYEIPTNGTNDVFFDLIDIEAVPLGETFDVVVKIENYSSEQRTITAFLSVCSVLYTGAAAGDIKKGQGIFQIGGGMQDTLQIQVTPEDYLDKLVDHGIIKIYAIASVEETRQVWSEEDDFTMLLPTISVSTPDTCIVNEPSDIEFSLRNPLKIPLTNCIFTVEGAGLHQQEIIYYRDIEPQEEITVIHNFTPARSGEREIVISFTSRQVQNVTTSRRIEVIGDDLQSEDGFESRKPINVVHKRRRRSCGSDSESDKD